MTDLNIRQGHATINRKIMITNTGFNPCGKLLPISLWKATKNIVSIMSRNIMTIYNNLSFRFWTRQQDSNLHIFQRELTFGSYTWDSVALPFELYRGMGLITDNSRLRFSRYLRGVTLSVLHSHSIYGNGS